MPRLNAIQHTDVVQPEIRIANRTAWNYSTIEKQQALIQEAKHEAGSSPSCKTRWCIIRFTHKLGNFQIKRLTNEQIPHVLTMRTAFIVSDYNFVRRFFSGSPHMGCLKIASRKAAIRVPYPRRVDIAPDFRPADLRRRECPYATVGVRAPFARFRGRWFHPKASHKTRQTGLDRADFSTRLAG